MVKDFYVTVYRQIYANKLFPPLRWLKVYYVITNYYVGTHLILLTKSERFFINGACLDTEMQTLVDKAIYRTRAALTISAKKEPNILSPSLLNQRPRSICGPHHLEKLLLY